MGREADAVRTGCITGGAECVTCFEHEGGTVGMTCESGPGLHSPRRVESLARASPHLQFDTQLRVSPSSLNDQVADWLIKHEHLFSHMKHGKWSGGALTDDGEDGLDDVGLDFEPSMFGHPKDEEMAFVGVILD